MYLLNLLKPQCLVREKVYFRYDFHLYVIKYFSGYEEMWAESLYEGGHHNYLLGTIKSGEWVRPKNFRLLKYNMQTQGASRLFNEYKNDKRDLPIKRKQKKQEKTSFTREDFQRWGREGQEKVRSKYKKSSGQIRWEKQKQT